MYRQSIPQTFPSRSISLIFQTNKTVPLRSVSQIQSIKIGLLRKSRSQSITQNVPLRSVSLIFQSIKTIPLRVAVKVPANPGQLSLLPKEIHQLIRRDSGGSFRRDDTFSYIPPDYYPGEGDPAFQEGVHTHTHTHTHTKETKLLA